MKFAFPLAACFVFLLSPLAVHAQDEPPEMELEFIRKLRAKGYNNLAVDYLERLKQKPSPGLAPLLPLEMARTRVSLAKEKEPSQQLGLLAEARTELEAFVTQNPKRPEAAQTRLEIARIASLQGQALLSQALRQDDAAREELARKAEQQFIQAGGELDSATKALADYVKSYKNPDPEQEKFYKQQLAEDLLQARLDRGRNFLDQAKTYLDLEKADVNRKRSAVVEEARKVLEEVAKDESGADPSVSYLGVAWLMKVAQEQQDPTKAKAYYTKIMNAADKDSQAAKRWAKYFRIQGIMEDPTETAKGIEKLRLIQKEGQDWLTKYGAYKNTPEGIGVRYELANAYLREAQSISTDPKSAKAAPLYNQAQALFAAVAEADSDLSEKATLANIQISFQKMGENTPISELKDFDECYLKARFEMAKVQEVAGKLAKAGGPERDKLEKARKTHMANIVASFRRSLKLAGTKTPAAKVNEARFYLTFVYLLAGDPYRAAVQGEDLARRQPPTKRSASAAGYALQAYNSILSRDNSETHRERLRSLANYIIEENGKLWANEPVLPIARYQLAMSYLREKNHVKAIEALENLPPDFSAYIFAQCQVAFTALLLRDDPNTPEAEKAVWQERALKALRRVPTLPAGADPATAQMFLAAQIEQAKILYTDASAELRKNKPALAAKKYQEMKGFVEQLDQQLKKAEGSIDQKPREELQYALNVLLKYARFGLSDLEYKAGNYDKVLSKELAGEVVAQVEQQGKDGGKIKLKDYQITGDIMGLALRASVQKGNIPQAQKILNLLQRLTSLSEVDIDPSAVLSTLLTELKTQIRYLRVSGDAAKLKATIASFSAFGDQLAKGRLERNDILLLANLYASLEQHQKAADLYAKIQLPKIDPAKPMTDEEKEKYEKERKIYWLIQVKQAESLRLAGQLAAARKVLDVVLNDPTSVGKLLAEKEMIHLLEDQGDVFGLAIKKWGQFMQNPSFKPQQLVNNNDMKTLYFEAYYHNAYCWYKYSQSAKIKGTPKEQEFVRRAADYIVRLENAKTRDGWFVAEPLFRELLRNEKLLNDEYERLKKESAAAS